MNEFLLGCALGLMSGVLGMIAYVAAALISHDFGVAILAGLIGIAVPPVLWAMGW